MIPPGVNQTYQSFDGIKKKYEDQRITNLAGRLFDAMILLDKKDSMLKTAHSDAVQSWTESGQRGDCPKRKRPPLEHAFELFNELFPKIILTYNSANLKLGATKGGQNYNVSALSDGEKQVFSILADFESIEDKQHLIIVDEPELNLHPELSERLWTLIENEFTNKTFIYATHSINFALRSNVNRVYVLSSESENITEFTNLGDLPRSEVTAFLGAIPGILSANKVLITEGHDKSFDAIFYRWLLNDKELEIHPAGNCSDVVSTVSKSGLWERITSKVTFLGVIDADYRNDTYLETLNTPLVTLLPYHEAESYLCVPEIIARVAERIGSQENLLTVQEVEGSIFAALESSTLAIAAQRVFARSEIRLGVSVKRSILAAASTRESLVSAMNRAAHDELNKASVAIRPDKLEDGLNSEIAAIEEIIRTRNVEMALRYLPGKQLLNTFVPESRV